MVNPPLTMTHNMAEVIGGSRGSKIAIVVRCPEKERKIVKWREKVRARQVHSHLLITCSVPGTLHLIFLYYIYFFIFVKKNFF